MQPRYQQIIGYRLTLLCLFYFLTGCTSTLHHPFTEGSALGFSSVMFEAPPFAFAGQLKTPSHGADALVVYIEGDGRLIAHGAISDNPTPRFPLGWLLARQDDAPAVMYLARLGQYNDAFTGTQYRPYWTEKRFAPEIIQSMNHVLDAAKERVAAKRIHLVGFSGGGAVTCLLAADRQDVASLVTVAGLLDHAFWTKQKKYEPLTGSLNPADVTNQLVNIPQLHLYGKNDTVIPPEISQHFLHRANFAHARRMEVNADHHSGCEQAWPALLSDQIIPFRNVDQTHQ